MQVSVETHGPIMRSMTVDVPEERISGAVEEQLKSMVKTSQVQGFRPGRAPLRVLRQRFGTRVRKEVVEELVNSSFYEALNQEDLEPVSPPLIDLVRAQVGRGLSYTATFEVLPEIRLNPLEDLRVEKPVCHIKDSDVDNAIEELRRQQGEFREVARAAGPGDRVSIDYQGVVEGEALALLKLEDVEVEIGEEMFIPGLGEGLKGACAGQLLELHLAFPADFINRDLAGKSALFQVQVNWVKEAVLSELDEEFFEALGVWDGGEQDFRRQVRGHVNREVKTALRNRYRDSIMGALYEANDVNVPDTLVNAEFDRMKGALDMDLIVRGRSTEIASLFTSTDNMRNSAQRRVAMRLLMTALVRAQNLRARPERVREIIEARARAYEDAASLIDWYYDNEERLAEIEAIALEDEVLDCVTARARVRETALSIDELMDNGQTDWS